MNDFSWRKIKNSDFPAVEKLLKSAENNYVNACSKFIEKEENSSFFWVLSGKKEISALIIYWKNNILPVLCGHIDSLNDFYKNFLSAKKIHSIQGLKDEVIALEKEINKNNREPVDIIDYDLMRLDTLPKEKNILSGFSKLILKTPQMTDIDGIAPLQAAYEQEEVLPKGATFNPASSRVNTSIIIAKRQVLAAEVDEKFIGKINVSAVSFTRYQVGGVYVCPEFRGKGVARQMTHEFISSLISEGRGVTLFVKKTNAAARRLYSNLGFKLINNYRISYY
jgi:ribosomal protein S18 acetylase RimI-like enzyme